MLALGAISFAARVLTGKDIAWNRGDVWVVIAYAVWGFMPMTANSGPSMRSVTRCPENPCRIGSGYATRQWRQVSPGRAFRPGLSWPRLLL